MEQYTVTGMSCAACQAKVEKAVSGVNGVNACYVNLLTNTMGVEGSAKPSDIIKAVKKAGYDAIIKDEKKDLNDDAYEDNIIDAETSKLKRRLLFSVILLIPLMYVSMAHMMWDAPLPSFLSENHMAMGLVQLIFTGLIMVINQRFFVNGFKGIYHRSPNMDSLVALGSMAAFIYSVAALFAMSDAMVKMDHVSVMKYMDEFYFESSATILTLITVGKMLEARAKGKTTSALKSLMKLSPKVATVIEDGKEKEVAIEDVYIGTVFVVKPGENIPVDGIIIKGNCAINESSLTGESIPSDKNVGDRVYAATSNLSGYIECEATKVGKDTTFAKIIKMVSEASASKAPISKIADKVSGIFVPTVMILSAITFFIWLITDKGIGFSLARAISVLVISCPCALGLATPVAIMVGNGLAAKNGILFKNAIALEETGKVQIAVLDKTGTITKGETKVRDIIPLNDCSCDELIKIAYSLETKSEHPLAKAIVSYAKEKSVEKYNVEDFKALAGSGLYAKINDKVAYAGNKKLISDMLKIDNTNEKLIDELSQNGLTPLLFMYDNKLIGIIAVSDVIKDDSSKAIAQLKNMGIHTVMLTGDNERTANAIAREVMIDEVIADVKPDEKNAIITKYKKYGKVAMVGDGINDAIALTSADVGIAIGAGTDVAIDAASVVLMKGSLLDAVAAIRISRKTLRNIHENLFWAFFYNCLGIPLAAGLLIPVFGLSLNPMFAAAAMSLSSFCVVSNALRINLLKVYNPDKDKIIKKIHIKKEQGKTMQITVKGMMCAHCEAHTKEALEKIDGVILATADHNTNTVTIETNKEVSEEAIKAAIDAAGYEYCGIK